MLRHPRRAHAVVLAAALALALPFAAGAVGTEFTWQGELRESGLPANGSYDFEFRLYAVATGGSPIGPLRTLSAQSITTGIYTALLDFSDQFTGEPRWLEISVRRAGQPTFTTLLPRQALTATPYAQHADFVADDSIVGANVVDGSISGADLAAGSISTTQIANGGVQSIDLADGSVTTPKIGSAAVTAQKIASAAVSTVALADGSVTAAKLAPGAIGAAQVDPDEVQQRVATRCPNELPMIGVGVDGTPACGNVTALLPDDVGVTPQVALREDGRPVVAYVDNLADDLMLASCCDPACASVTVVTLDTNVGNPVGSFDVAVRSNGRPFVAYRDGAADALHAFDCSNEYCTSSAFRSLDAAPGAGHGTSIAVRSGDLVLVSYRQGANEVRAYDCDNVGCSSGAVRQLATIDVDNDSRTAVVLAVGDTPTVFFEGENGFDGLNAYNCLNADCTSGGRVDLNDANVERLAAVAGSDAAQVAYASGALNISLFTCAGTLGVCPSGTSENVFFGTPLNASVDLALAADETPYVAALVGNRLAIQDCGNETCSSGTLRNPDPVSGRGGAASMALRADGRPVVAYEDNGGIRIIVCGNAGCAP